MTRGYFRRGQPVIALIMLLGGWVSARAMMWDAGDVPRVSVVPPTPGNAAASAPRLAAAVQLPSRGPVSRPAMQFLAPPVLSGEPLFDPSIPAFDELVTLDGDAGPPRSADAAPARLLHRRAGPWRGSRRWRAAWHREARRRGPLVLSLAPAEADPQAAPGNVAPYPVAPAAGAGARRWSADSWLLWRRGSSPGIAAGGFAPTYGASQAGAVLRYRLAPGDAHRLAAFLRASAALNGSNEREVALGLQARPFAGWPLVLAAEARVTATAGGRAMVRPAVFAVTELPPFRLPLGFRGEAYGQGGYVGGKFATAFADGQLRVDRRLLGLGPAEMRLGGGVWGGVQKGAARLDAGPSVLLSAPFGGRRIDAAGRGLALPRRRPGRARVRTGGNAVRRFLARSRFPRQRVCGSGWRAMDVYLPIANLSVNGLVIVALGALTGVLSGMLGVGGGFLTTPLLIFYGVPPTVAAASAASQVTGASVSGVFAHGRRGGVDRKMGAVMVAGGVVGTGIGAVLFRMLEELGQIDTVINILYVADARLDRHDHGAREPAGAAGAQNAACRSRRASAATIRSSPACRCAGGSMARASTYRRWRRCCWGSSPAS